MTLRSEPTAVLPGKESCPGYLSWSAFGAGYADTVCASILEWPEGVTVTGLCDADDDFRPKDIPCPYCDPDSFIDYQWGVGDGEAVVLWETDEQPVVGDVEVHFHENGPTLWWTATHPQRGEERVLFRSLIDDEEED